MTIEQLMYFSEAAKYSSFSVAAEKTIFLKQRLVLR